MRILKSLLLVLGVVAALFAGVFVVIVVAVAAAIFLLIRRWLRPKTPHAPRSGRRRPAAPRTMEAIDVVATEIPSEPPPR